MAQRKIDIEGELKKAIKIPLKKIKEYQHIVIEQQKGCNLGYGKCTSNNSMLRLQYMELVYQAARDIKEFDGSITEWAEYIKGKIDYD